MRVRLIRRVGHFVPEGVALFGVSPAERLDATRGRELSSAYEIGPSRTMQQDVEFGVIQIVDIALRRFPPRSMTRAPQSRIGTESLLDTAFEQIRHYSASDIAVSLWLLRAFDDIAATCVDPRIVESLAARGRRVLAGCAARLQPDQTEKLRERLGALEARTAATR